VEKLALSVGAKTVTQIQLIGQPIYRSEFLNFQQHLKQKKLVKAYDNITGEHLRFSCNIFTYTYIQFFWVKGRHNSYIGSLMKVPKH